MISRPIKFLIIFFIIISGCAYLTHIDGLSTLDSLGKSQEDIDRYIKNQEKLFYVLREDVANKNVYTGLTKKDIIKKYGEPVLNKNIDSGNEKSVFLYRHPIKYYSNTRIYLYFGYSDKLTRCQVDNQ